MVEPMRLVKTARMAGLWYFLLAVTGVLGFMVFHPQVYVSDDPAQTLTNLTEHETLARIRLLFELAIIVSQALAAVWFYKLFREIDPGGAWALGIWGMMNSAAIMISAISMGTAIGVTEATLLSNEDKLVLIHLLGQLITHAWGVGSLFFGLWLIPMGYIILRSNRMPLWLGRILIIGGFGYLLSPFIGYMGFGGTLTEVLVLPATVGEFWMIGYLLLFGIRESKDT